MKEKLLAIVAIAALTAFTSTSRADTYTDTTGDLHNGVPTGVNFTNFKHLDITSVDVTNTATDLVFKIKLDGDPIANNWGKYCIGIDTNSTTGDTNATGNGWVRPISMNIIGMDFWVGSWVDGGNGAQLWTYNGASWVGPTAASVSVKTTNSVTLSFPFASLGKGFGDTVDFDVYTTAGGPDSAVDALNNPSPAITNWAGPYTNNTVSTYTLQVVTAVPHTVKFTVDMGVPIWEYDNAIGDGFSTNTDALFLRGSFNGWAGTDQLFQVGASTLFTNTFVIVATPGDIIQYKFEGFSFPGYESPVLTGGANRTLTLTNTTMPPQYVCFGDRCLTNPPVSTVNLSVDMSVALNFGVFDPSTNSVTLPGSFNGWNTAFPLTAGVGPLSNIYSGTITFNYYPLGVQNAGFYKFFISNYTNAVTRGGGWEAPISTGGNNRSFGIPSTNQSLAFIYNDENPVINASIQKLNANDVAVTFSSFPSRGGGYPTGGVYAVESRASLTSPWTTNTVVGSTDSSTSVTNTGVLPGNPQQFYRVGLIGL